MTTEQRVKNLEEQMLVQAGLMVRLENRLDQFSAHVEAWVNATENRLAQNEVRMVQLEERHSAVLQRLDRFIAGREGNGEKRH